MKQQPFVAGLERWTSTPVTYFDTLETIRIGLHADLASLRLPATVITTLAAPT